MCVGPIKHIKALKIGPNYTIVSLPFCSSNVYIGVEVAQNPAPLGMDNGPAFLGTINITGWENLKLAQYYPNRPESNQGTDRGTAEAIVHALYRCPSL